MISPIDTAFVTRPDLQKRIHEAIAKYAELEQLFVDIAEHTQNPPSAHSPHSDKDVGLHTSKKRKFNVSTNGTKVDTNTATSLDKDHWASGSYRTINELSFSIPQRKKLTLEVGSLPGQGIRARNPSTNEVEFEVRWDGVQHVVCLPVPEKAQAQYNFCIFPILGDGLSHEKPPAEQILWTVPNTIPKAGSLGPGIAVDADETYKGVITTLLNNCLKSNKNRVIEPDESDFTSQAVQAHRKGEKIVHVKAFRGSKDGFLFFLPTGIVWGFKKPLIFFAFDSIDSVSYTSILQRTFNLNIATRTATDEDQEFEFSMIDQADFSGIDTYLKRHQLQDASMAEQRRAKKLNINGVKGEESTELEAEEGELEKATREAEDLEDQEEEEDENFDPGSEGESEGSGSSEEEEDDGDGQHDGEDDGDSVENELRGEAGGTDE